MKRLILLFCPTLFAAGESVPDVSVPRTPSPILREMSQKEATPILFVNTIFVFQESKEIRMYNNLKAQSTQSNLETKKTYAALCKIERTAGHHGVSLNKDFADIISNTEVQIIKYDLAIIEFGQKLKEHAARLAHKYGAIAVLQMKDALYINPNCDVTLEILDILNNEFEMLYGEQ